MGALPRECASQSTFLGVFQGAVTTFFLDIRFRHGYRESTEASWLSGIRHPGIRARSLTVCGWKRIAHPFQFFQEPGHQLSPAGDSVIGTGGCTTSSLRSTDAISRDVRSSTGFRQCGESVSPDGLGRLPFPGWRQVGCFSTFYDAGPNTTGPALHFCESPDHFVEIFACSACMWSFSASRCVRDARGAT